MKGIVLAGGLGTRLYPGTSVVSKQLLPLYDKPMIYYPLSILMRAGIRDINIIVTPENLRLFKDLLKDGKKFGLNITFTIQDNPNGIAEAFIITEDWLGDDNVCLILGDNFFYGENLEKHFTNARENTKNSCATLFTYEVSDPSSYGIVTKRKDGSISKIVEKPKNSKSNLAVTGLYFYDNTAIEKAKKLVPSDRGELEITDLNNLYLQEGNLKLEELSRGFAWLDTGTPSNLLATSTFVETIQKRTGVIIGCLEEIALNNSWITKEELEKTIVNSSDYCMYLQKLITEENAI